MIYYHHIGGRSGTYPLPVKSGPLLNDISFILYDADSNCLDQMESMVKQDKDKVFPYLIVDGKEHCFQLTFQPTNSSVLAFNEKYKNFTYVHYPKYGEYKLGDGFKTVETLNIQSSTLTDVIVKEEIGLDFLSLDVQGAEFDILSSSINLLNNDIVGVQLEVEFLELYKNQKKSSDIDLLMQENGFILIDIRNVGRLASRSLPIGFRATETPGYADFVYIKNSDQVKDTKKIIKAALFSLIYGQMGLCLDFLSKIQLEDFGESAYERLLLQIVLLHEKNNLYMPQYGELFTKERIKKLYSVNKEEAWYVDDTTKELIGNKYSSFIEEVHQTSSSKETEIECLLKKYGLEEVAEIIENNRLRDAKFFLSIMQEHGFTKEG